MVLELTRVDYALVGLTSNNCMKLLPIATGGKGTQKIVIGGNDGVIKIFFMKKGEVCYVFKYLPGPRVTSVQLGGAPGTPRDKIFVSSKNEVKGFTKKGKQFLGFDTNLTESITSIAVSGNDLMVIGSHVYNHYKDCKDANSYICGDKLNDVITLSVEKAGRLVSVLACEDRTLKVVERSSVAHIVVLGSAPTRLSLLFDDGGETGDAVVYATDNGEIGLVQIARSGVNMKWTIENDKKREAVTCMCWYDMTKDGFPDLIVGREDGSIQIYSQPYDPILDTAPLQERFNYVCSESITSIQAGYVGNPSFDEIVATTYTGWLFGLTTEVLEKQMGREGKNPTMSLKITNDEKTRMENLKMEIDEIEQKVIKERERYQAMTQEDSIGMSTIPPVHISDKLMLIKEDSVLQLTLETETPIDNVLLQADIPVRLLDVEKNSAVVSHNPIPPSGRNRLLATYRCQVNTTRMSVLLEPSNCEGGTLTVYVTPHSHPKAAHQRMYLIRPLCLFYRLSQFPEPPRDWSKLSMRGQFSMAEIHNWLSVCLPELPDRGPVDDQVTYNYVNSYSGAFLRATYRKGEAEFLSEDVTAISTIKEVLTKEATKKKINLSLSLESSEEGMRWLVGRLAARLEEENEKSRQGEMLEALRDIETNEADSVLSLAASSRQTLANPPPPSGNAYALARIQGVILSTFADWFRIREINPKPRMLQLQTLIKGCSQQDLINLLKGPESLNEE